MKGPIQTFPIISATTRWLETMVIGLNLCPFASREWNGDRIRIEVSRAKTPGDLLVDLDEEIGLLQGDSTLATTLLVHPFVLEDFSEYNQFLDVVDMLLQHKGLVGVFQIATFHPQYQFAGTDPGDIANATNQSPYPLLHILREKHVSSAVASHPDAGLIPEQNIALLREMGAEKVHALLKACFKDI